MPKPASEISLPGKPVPLPREPVVIGHIARALGVLGDVKATVEAEDKNRLDGIKRLVVRIDEGCFEFIPVSIKARGGYLQIRFAGVDSPEMAAKLAGGDIIISKFERPELSACEFYIDDLIGCRVETDDGEELGLLIEVWPQAHHDLWVIDGSNGDILIPAVKDFIAQVDLAQHKVVVKRMEGLWE
ncbi:MAG: 16S rRNA processing protein RimM [Calditrichaeota bacterium]|nr:16S rRNA processing protein RimM [Calditrichota bacterium]